MYCMLLPICLFQTGQAVGPFSRSCLRVLSTCPGRLTIFTVPSCFSETGAASWFCGQLPVDHYTHGCSLGRLRLGLKAFFLNVSVSDFDVS